MVQGLLLCSLINRNFLEAKTVTCYICIYGI